MAIGTSQFGSSLSSGTGDAVTGLNLNTYGTRRVFNFGDRIAELAPEQSPFFVYLSKVAKKATDDPVFKFLEQRHLWSKRYVMPFAEAAGGDVADGVWYTADGSKHFTVKLESEYDAYGKKVSDAMGSREEPFFVVEGDIIRVKCWFLLDGTGTDTAEGTYNAEVVGVPSGNEVKLKLIDTTVTASTSKIAFERGTDKFPIVGSAFSEATGAPEGWKDKLSDSEGYCQIFKTSIPLFSGSAQATRYRGIANEYQRVWQEKLIEHKMDLEHAFLYGVGNKDDLGHRYTHGIVPWIESNSPDNVFDVAWSGTAAASEYAGNYDGFLTLLEKFYDPTVGNSGDKLVLASRSVLTWLNKLGADSFINSTAGSSSYKLDVQNVTGNFGHSVSTIDTIYGKLHFVQEPLFRGIMDDMAVMIDMKNVAYRPLVGNGINRDTQIKTNIQENDIDGRKDMILTEAGLEISVPEVHGMIKFGAGTG